MAVIGSDTFTEASNTELSLHTPDTGDGWTKALAPSGRNAQVESTNDRAEPDGSTANDSMIYTFDTVPGDADYDISGDIRVTNLTDGLFLIGRHADNSNYYGAGTDGLLFDSPNTLWDLRVFKVVSGTPTSLGAQTFTNKVQGATFKFECNDAAKKLFVDGVEKISSTDNVLTATGKAGLGWGALLTSTIDMSASAEVDNFSLDGVEGSAVETPGAGTLTLTGFNPSILLDQPIGASTLSLTGFAPISQISSVLSPGFSTLTLTGFAPTIDFTNNSVFQPGVAALVLDGQQVTTDTQNAVGVGSLGLTGFAPNVQIADSNPVFTPGFASLMFGGFVPTVLRRGWKPVVTSGDVWTEVAGSSGVWIPVLENTDPWT